MYIYLFSAERPDQDIELYDELNSIMIQDNFKNGGEGKLGIEDIYLVDENVIAVLTKTKDLEFDVDDIPLSKHDVEIKISKKKKDKWDEIVEDYISKYF